ncbi:MAG TPA: gephyrin-like molybdotransferase Glp [Planctomycetota bacterium]|nr:gephyrin-like molybdotransferase Glp [Planctomycetota bacterium]
MLTVEQALEIILSNVPRPKDSPFPLAAAVGKVLAEDCASDLDMPPFDKAMMDGYAVRSEDAGPLKVIEEIPAGKVPKSRVRSGTCAKIMTGAPVPAGADAVQQVEKTSREGDSVTLAAPVKPGQNIAPRATDMRKGEVVLRAGHRIRPADIGALAAIGKTRVRAAKGPTCAVVATGDELVPPSRKPGPGQIRNSNTASLRAQVEALGLECADLGIVPDDTKAIRAAIRKGLRHDLLILSGGVSAGSWDLVIPALQAEGIELKMHQVLIKPGRPFCFAPRVFGLPGNPVSSFVIFEVFVRPYIGKLMGANLVRPRIRARLLGELPRKIDRVHYLPAKVWNEGSEYVAEPVPWQGSADLFALTKANGFVIVPIQTTYGKGDGVDCMLLD